MELRIHFCFSQPVPELYSRDGECESKACLAWVERDPAGSLLLTVPGAAPSRARSHGATSLAGHPPTVGTALTWTDSLNLQFIILKLLQVISSGVGIVCLET